MRRTTAAASRPNCPRSNTSSTGHPRPGLFRYYGTGTFGARTKVFSNWGDSYNVIVGVGDITGDGKADLVSRDTGGNVWHNNSDGKGSFGARTRIATGWQGYKGLF